LDIATEILSWLECNVEWEVRGIKVRVTTMKGRRTRAVMEGVLSSKLEWEAIIVP